MSTNSDGLFRICQDYDSDNSSDQDMHLEDQSGVKDDDTRNCHGNTSNSRYI